MDAQALQEGLNLLRAARPEPLRSIPVTDKLDKATRDALRCFQHEHNMFSGQRTLKESGRPNRKTAEAIEWWTSILTKEQHLV